VAEDFFLESIEMFQLPAPNFIASENFMKVIVYSPKTLRQMDRMDKVRACYQHCCLRYVSGDYMTNSSLRERFNIPEKNYSTVSRIISDSISEGLVSAYDEASKSRKFAGYIPFWV